MSANEPPPLPDDDDAFRLLGLDPQDATETDVKRAWTRLIRIYRPDRHPEAFARVRAAYEEAVERVRARGPRPDAAVPEAGGEPREDPEAGRAESRAPCPEAEAALRAVAEGRAAEGEALLAEARAAEPTRAALGRAAFLLGEVVGAEERALEGLAASFATDPDVASWATKVLEAHEWSALATSDGLTLGTLARQRGVDATLLLMRRRIDGLLASERTADLLREAEDPGLLDRAASDPRFVWPVVEVACAAAWSHPAEAERLQTRMRRVGVGDADVESTLEVRLGTRAAWESWKRSHGHLRALTSFLEIGPALGYAALRTEARIVAAAAGRAPGEHLEALGDLTTGPPDLPVQVWEMLAAAREGQQEDAEQVAVRRQRRVAPIRAALRSADEALGRDWMNVVVTWGIVGGIALTVYLFVAHGVWGWAGVGGSVLWLFLGVGKGDARLYRKILRPRIAALVTQTGCAPEEILANLKTVTKISDDVGRFTDEIESDAGLELLTAILEVARQR